MADPDETLSDNVECPTPQYFFDMLDAEYGPFDLDPASTHTNAKCKRHYTKEDDGLTLPWTGRVYCNPPYGLEIREWVERASIAHMEKEADIVVMLIPARTDTLWYHEFVLPFADVYPVKRRLKFINDAVAKFPNAVAVYRCDGKRRKVKTYDAASGKWAQRQRELAAARAVA